MTAPDLRPPTGNRAFWAMVSTAAAVRAAVMVSACCVAGILAERVDAQGIEGLWAGRPSALPATVGVAVTAAGAVVGSVAAVRMAWSPAAFRRRVSASVVDLPDFVRAAATRAGLADRIAVVDDGRPFALTYGLFRPTVLVSTGLVALLDPAELGAVLAHEREHVRSRDPLRTALVRVVAGRLFFLPVITEVGERFALGREMAADRRAVSLYGRRAVAGALLRVVDHPGWVAGAPAAAMGSARMLDARIRQLEGGRLPWSPLSRRRLLMSLMGVAVLVWAAVGSTAVAAQEHGGRCATHAAGSSETAGVRAVM